MGIAFDFKNFLVGVNGGGEGRGVSAKAKLVPFR